MLLYENNTPPSQIVTKKTAQSMATAIESSDLDAPINICSEAKEYIICEISDTIRHEAGHRKGEQRRGEEQEDLLQNIRFKPQRLQDIPESELEQEAEQEERGCVPPTQLSGEAVTTTRNELLGQAVQRSNIPWEWQRDIKAGHLDQSMQGMYLMQQFEVDGRTIFPVFKTNTENVYKGFDGTVWVDIDKIIRPYLMDESSPGRSEPAKTQGIAEEYPAGQERTDADMGTMVPSREVVPSVPVVPSR